MGRLFPMAAREYTVYGARSKAGYILYFVDDTTFKAISKEFRERRPVVCLASFDNREELVRDSLGGDDSRVTGEVDAVLRRWVIQEMNGFIYRLDSSRYLFVVDDAHIEQAKQKRFRVLDEVRAIRSARNNMSATVSIGVGPGGQRRGRKRALGPPGPGHGFGPGRRPKWLSSRRATPMSSSAASRKVWKSGIRCGRAL